MKFAIEVEDFWLDEDEDLSNGLKAHIKNEVVCQISKNIKEMTEKQITERLQNVIKQKMELVIDSTLTDLLATGMIIVNRKEISIGDYIKQVFRENQGWHNPREQIARIAKDFSQELKKQYNMVFANEIVVKMKEQGFLKDDLVQILLKDESKGGE